MSWTRLAVFLGVFSSLLALIHYYLWSRLVRDPNWSPGISKWLTVGIFTLGALIPILMAGSRMVNPQLIRPLAWVGFLWLGVMFLLFVGLIPIDLARMAIWLRSVLTPGENPFDVERRQFFSKIAAGIIAPTALITAGVGIGFAVNPKIKKVHIPMGKLNGALRGFTIVQMTDIHVGPTVNKAFIEDLVKRCNALEPDMIAITGDLVDGSVEEIGHAVEPLGKLKAKHGVFFVTGNHEYYSGADAWIGFLIGLGIRVLHNERVTLEHNGAFIDIAGVDDATAHEFGSDHGADYKKALSRTDASAPLVLLAHQPKAILEAAALGVDLQISGHTHGGQIFPFNFLVPLAQPFVEGLHRYQNSWVYVSPGTGYWGPPMRVGTRSEITQIILDSQATTG